MRGLFNYCVIMNKDMSYQECENLGVWLWTIELGHYIRSFVSMKDFSLPPLPSIFPQPLSNVGMTKYPRHMPRQYHRKLYHSRTPRILTEHKHFNEDESKIWRHDSCSCWIPKRRKIPNQRVSRRMTVNDGKIGLMSPWDGRSYILDHIRVRNG